MEHSLEILRLGLHSLADDASKLIDEATDLVSDEAAIRIQTLRLKIDTILSQEIPPLSEIPPVGTPCGGR